MVVRKKESLFSEYDLNKDGEIDLQDIENVTKLEEIQRAERRQRHQRYMAWYALVGMLNYPIAIIFTEWVGLTNASKLLTDIAPTYFIAAAGVAGAFMGVSAWMNRKN